MATQAQPRTLTGKFFILTVYQTFDETGKRTHLRVTTLTTPTRVEDTSRIRYGYLTNEKPIFSVVDGEMSKLFAGHIHRFNRFYLPVEYWKALTNTADFFMGLKEGYTDLLTELNCKFNGNKY